jgi:ankyrin repeat protein
MFATADPQHSAADLSIAWKQLLNRSWNSRETMRVAHALVVLGVDVNIADDKGQTAVHRLAVCYDYEPAVGLLNALVEAGADVNLRDRNGITPLVFLAFYDTSPHNINDQRHLLAALRAAGADPHLGDDDGRTPINNSEFRKRWELLPTP